MWALLWVSYLVFKYETGKNESHGRDLLSKATEGHLISQRPRLSSEVCIKKMHLKSFLGTFFFLASNRKSRGNGRYGSITPEPLNRACRRSTQRVARARPLRFEDDDAHAIFSKKSIKSIAPVASSSPVIGNGEIKHP